MTLGSDAFKLGENDFGYRRLSNGMLIVNIFNEKRDQTTMETLQELLQFMVLFFTILTIIVLGTFFILQILHMRDVKRLNRERMEGKAGASILKQPVEATKTTTKK